MRYDPIVRACLGALATQENAPVIRHPYAHERDQFRIHWQLEYNLIEYKENAGPNSSLALSPLTKMNIYQDVSISIHIYVFRDDSQGKSPSPDKVANCAVYRTIFICHR